MQSPAITMRRNLIANPRIDSWIEHDAWDWYICKKCIDDYATVTNHCHLKAVLTLTNSNVYSWLGGCLAFLMLWCYPIRHDVYKLETRNWAHQENLYLTEYFLIIFIRCRSITWYGFRRIQRVFWEPCQQVFSNSETSFLSFCHLFLMAFIIQQTLNLVFQFHSHSFFFVTLNVCYAHIWSMQTNVQLHLLRILSVTKCQNWNRKFCQFRTNARSSRAGGLSNTTHGHGAGARWAKSNIFPEI